MNRPRPPVFSNQHELKRLSLISNAILGVDEVEKIAQGLDEVKGKFPHLNEKQWQRHWALKQKIGQFGAVLNFRSKSDEH